MAKVYVSSTYSDLKDYREKVRVALRRLGHEDVAMEYYVAEDVRPAEKCLADVAASDLYVGVFAWRYGYVPAEDNPERLSVTEMEYRRARESGKDCLIFLLDPNAPWPPALVDEDRTPIKRLRDELSARHLVGLFNTADDLTAQMSAAVYDWSVKRGLVSPRTDVPELDFERYFAALARRYQRLDLDALTPPQKEEYLQLHLRSVFVEPNVRESPPPVELPKEVWERLRREREVHSDDLPSGLSAVEAVRAREVYYEKPPRPVLDVLTETRQQRCLILGDPGSGKSTLARYVLLSLSKEDGDEKLRRVFGGCLPLLIELRSYAGLRAENKCTTFLEFLDYMGKAEGWGLSREALERYLKTVGAAVVIFDGLDEIFDPAAREEVARRIAGFASDYPRARVFVTSRVVGYRRKVLADAGFTHFTLQDLDERQVGMFVDRWYSLALSDRPEEAAARRERIMRSFQNSPSIRQLAGNPMLLTIMAIIGKNQELPRERWKLYDHAAGVLLEHWDINKHLRDQRLQADFIGEEDKKELLRRLAYRMQNAEGGLAGNYVHRDELQAEFEGYLTERYKQPPDQAARIARAMIEQFRARNFILSLYGANVYGFVHRAFLEYFCATAILHKFEKTQELTLDDLKAVYGAHHEDRSWHEVLRLICGMIAETKAGEIIDFLTSLEPPADGYTRERPPWNIALAIQCLGELRNPGTVAAPATRLLQAVCSIFEAAIAGRLALTDFLRDPVASSAEAIGTAWPDRQMLADWLMKPRSLPNSSIYAESLGSFVGAVGGGIDRIHRMMMRFAARRDPNYRVLVPFTLARGWHDEPGTLRLLRDSVTADWSDHVRGAVVRALAEHYRDDPQTLPLLQERATTEESDHVRSVAVGVLAERYRDDPQTLPLVRDRATADGSVDVRRAAVRALAEHYGDDPQTPPLLRDRALNDKHWLVCEAAVEALAEHYRDDPQTLPLLRDRATNDGSEYVRGAAVEALARHYRDDPQTLPLLHDRATADAGHSPRSGAVGALAEHYRDDPQTLPLLRDRATADESGNVRSTAVKALAEHYRDDPQTLPLLRDRATADESDLVRGATVWALVRYCRDDPQTLPFVRDRATADESGYVSFTAVGALVWHYRDDPQTLPLLRDWTSSAKLNNVRSEAVGALAEHYRDDPQTLQLVRDRAASDESWLVRDAAVRTLAEHYRDDPQTLPLLRDRATADESKFVRRAAVRGLARQYWNDPQTLPLLDSLRDEKQPELVRRAAAEASQEIRWRRVELWIEWLNGYAEEEELESLPEAAEGFPAIKVRAVRLENIRAFAEPDVLELSEGEGQGPRPLTLFLGDNSTGKSTLLRCIALAALGPEMANQVEKRPASYLRLGAERGLIEVSFSLQLDAASEPEVLGEFTVGLTIRAGQNSFLPAEDADLKLGKHNAADRLALLRRRTEDTFGFFCGYGALRSLADNPSALVAEEPKESHERVVSLFRSSAPLMDPDVLGKMLAGDLSNFRNAPTDPLDEEARRGMAEHLLKLMPEVAAVEQAQGSPVKLHGLSIPLRDLSEGYGSLLALVGHLFRQALAAKRWRGDTAQIFGVALVDEIDLHLHPGWQRRVLLDLRAVFPNLQLICSTHSAMVAGSVPTESVVVLRREDGDLRLLSGDELPSVGGWSADQILTSILFELPTTRNVHTQALFYRYAQLLKERGPEDAEVRELGAQVSREMELEGEGEVDANTHRLLDELLTQKFKSLSGKTRDLVLAKAGLLLSDGEGRHD